MTVAVRRPDIHHVPLPVGSAFSADGSRGYHIDFRRKIDRPVWERPPDETNVMWVTDVMQAGLAAFEHFVHTASPSWLGAARSAADYLVEAQEREGVRAGAWSFQYAYPHTFLLEPPWVMGMAQGEGASLLVRVGRATGRDEYLDAATRALSPLWRRVSDGGTSAKLPTGSWVPEEYPTSPPSHVLNGAIFALYGVHDVWRCLADEDVGRRYDDLRDALARALPLWDLGYWSRYDLFPHRLVNIASPFYHRLHVNQLRAWERFDPDPRVRETRERFEMYERRQRFKARALARKVAFRIAIPGPHGTPSTRVARAVSSRVRCRPRGGSR